MKRNQVSTKLGEEGRNFLMNMNHSRITLKKQNGKITNQEDELSYDDNLSLIVKYFKYNNDRYLELIKMENNK